MKTGTLSAWVVGLLVLLMTAGVPASAGPIKDAFDKMDQTAESLFRCMGICVEKIVGITIDIDAYTPPFIKGFISVDHCAVEVNSHATVGCISTTHPACKNGVWTGDTDGYGTCFLGPHGLFKST